MQVHPYYYSKTKRVFDLLTSATLLVLLTPIMGVIAIVILATAGWPVIYTQQRWGQNKVPFSVNKFRVMYVGAHRDQWKYRRSNQAPSPMYKNWHDPRYVGIGRWLSKTGLDELPQLVNILKGDMSLVGPRPLPIKEAMELPKTWSFRFLVKPGVFSEWSVSEKRHESLATWKKLEERTLVTGGLPYDLSTIKRTFF